jgi:hypothetical protein
MSGRLVAAMRMTAHGVYLVHNDDGRRRGLGLLEEVPDPRGAHAYEHLHEIRAGDGEEWHSRFPGHRPGQQGLSGTGRPVEQHSLGDLGSQGMELTRVS